MNACFRALRQARNGEPLCLLLIFFLLHALYGSELCAAQREPAGAKALNQLSLEQLGNVKVTTASKEPEEVWNTAAAIFVITQEDIRRSGATNLPDVLRLAPGVEVAQLDSDKWAIGIRGFQGRLSKSVLVLIDGRSVYTPLFAGVYWEVQDVPLEDIERIEVIRGPGGTIWGANAVNGVINIITKSAKDTHGLMLSGGGGTVERGFLTARYGSGDDNFSYRVYGSGFSRGSQFHPDHMEFDGWEMGQGGFRTDWNPTPRDTVTIEGDAYGTVAGQSQGISTYSPPALVVTDGNGYFFGQNILGRWRRTLSSSSDIQVQAYFDRTDRHDINYREIRNTFDLDVIHHIILPRNEFIWGGGIRVSPSHFIQTVPSVIFTPEYQTYNIFSGFVQDQISIVPRHLSFIVGTKLEHNTFSGFEVQPSGRLLWTPNDHHTVWAAITRAVRTPSRIEEGFQFTNLATTDPVPIYVRLIGDGDFSAEQLNGYELGYRALFTPSAYLDVATFYNQYDDLLSVELQTPFVEPSPSVHVILPLSFRNGILGNTRGIEISPVWNMTKWWRFKGSYSYVHLSMRNKSTSIDLSTVGQLEGDSPQHKAVIQSYFELPKNFQLDLAYRYVSSLPDFRVSAYSTADARLGWRINRQFELSLVGQNLFQPEHAEYGGDPGPLVGIRRGVYAKLTWTR